jgi:hypothetical protein
MSTLDCCYRCLALFVRRGKNYWVSIVQIVSSCGDEDSAFRIDTHHKLSAVTLYRRRFRQVIKGYNEQTENALHTIAVDFKFVHRIAPVAGRGSQ